MGLTRGGVKYASFAHSLAYFVLLISALGGFDDVKYVFGWVHGLGWFAMCALVLVALRQRLIDYRLAVAVAVLGAVGPFIGSAEFIRQDRRRRAISTPT